MSRKSPVGKIVILAARCLAVVTVLFVLWSMFGHGDPGGALLAVTPVAAIQNRNKRLVALAEKKSKLVAKMQKLLDEADGETLDEKQEADYQALEQQLAEATAAYDREYALEETREWLKLANTPPPDEPNLADAKNTKPAWEDDPKLGYKSQAEFLTDVMGAARTGATNDKLNFLAAAGSDEQSGQSDPYGAFFLPEGLAPGVLSVGFGGDPTNPTMVPMTTPILNTNARTDKDHSTSVSGGLTVGRNIETQSAESSRQKYEQVKLEAREQAGVAYASEQLLARSPISFVALLEQGFRDEFAAAMMKEKISGTGAGEPLGVLNSPAKIAVAKEAGPQTADTINGTNIMKMRARQWNYERSIWIANHDTLVQLMQCHIAGTNGDVFLFAPGNGRDVPPTLFGRPIYFSQFAKTLGDEGDLINVDWTQYLWGYLGSMMPNRAESIHVRFLQSERTFKFWVENDGQPWWRSALTPAESSTTLSPIVTLAERA